MLTAILVGLLAVLALLFLIMLWSENEKPK
jgi:hypothetical protein